ncbi:2-amino-4-hydroxy-6-hydroxymethyldihydropteridine diphosphokinase [Benzoatithermus flavus]|uniref:2-amino-4-hydroxy-6-hydroxymethyldihydropteridine pyrophosphokinase n=1 Tax=Benzoatithermus flavus TaxID=3108223 RepID=A0ABU8XPP6_9PROT
MSTSTHHRAKEEATRHAVVALGANLGDRQATLERAVALIAAEIGTVVARSRWLETPALIHPDDPARSYPDFLNGAVLVRTGLAAPEILRRLHAIEARLGRDRSKETARWRPRLIDLDLIAVEDLVVDAPDLRLPHPEMHKRDFVLAPFCEVWPDWRHPELGRTAKELLTALRGA